MTRAEAFECIPFEYFYSDLNRMVKSSVFISSYPLALDAVSLGRLVSFVKDPGQDSFNPATELPDKPQAPSSTTEINNIVKILSAANGAGLELTLTSFASAFLKGESKKVRQLETKQGVQYLLLNADNWFERICKSDLTRTWLERVAMRGRKAYLVTGVRTLKDVELTMDKSWKLGVGAGAQLPFLAAAGVPLSTPLDPGAKADYSIERGSKNVGSVPDEKVYGVQYREIRLRKVLSSMSSAPNLTTKIFWEQIYSDRGASDAEMDDDEDEMIEAQLLEGIEDVEELSSVAAEDEEEVYLHA